MDGKEFTSREEELEFLGGGKYFFHAETGATRFFIVHALPREQNFIHAWSWGGYFIFASHFA